MNEPIGAGGFAEVSRERLGRAQSIEMLQYVWVPYADLDDRNVAIMVACNKAHTVMLTECGLITPQEAHKVLDALNTLDRDPASLAYDPVRGDLFFNIESNVIVAAGEEAGGKMHIGRSRIDLIAALMRLRVRENLVALLEALSTLRAVVLERAEESVDCIMQAYTHLQPAQITTFAHYALAFFDATTRDWVRMMAAYSTVNASPLGGAATSGTAWPIDRQRLADLLGFDSVVENTKDAGHNFDWLLEAVAASSILMNDVGRLAWDLYIWCSHEFGMVRLDGSVSASSSIMPQKQNPYSLEMIRARTGEIGATFGAIFDVLKGDTGGTAFDIKLVGPRIADTAVGRTADMVRLTSQVVRTLHINRDRMAQAAGAGFSTAVELADTLVRKYGLSFRSAHLVTGHLVRLATEQRLEYRDVGPALVEQAAQAVVGRRLGISEDDVRSALDPVAFLNTRNSAGGPGQTEVARMLAMRKAEHEVQLGALQELKRKLDRAGRILNDAVSSLT
jgi:argininosuccinate lyase